MAAFDFITIPESERWLIRLHRHGDLIHAPIAALIYQFREVLAGRHTRVAELKQPVFSGNSLIPSRSDACRRRPRGTTGLTCAAGLLNRSDASPPDSPLHPIRSVGAAVDRAAGACRRQPCLCR
jgi:hypothetical protein